MIIDDVEVFLIEVERTDAYRPVRSLIVRLDSDDGREGWGEAPWPQPPGGRAPHRSTLRSLLEGRSVFCVDEILESEALSSAPLRLAVEMAVWDLIGRTLKQPLCRLWGGAYRPAVPLAARLPAGSPRRSAEVARAWAEQGVLTQTVEAVGNVAADADLINQMRTAVGNRLRLRLDLGGQYSPTEALDLCRELEYDPPEFVIDPIKGGDFFAVASLARQTLTPLALCRLLARPADVFAAARCGAGATLMLDPARIGSLRDLRFAAAVATAGGAAAAVCGPPSVGIATAAVLQIVASMPELGSSYECVYRQLKEDVLRKPIACIDGNAVVPMGPGVGVEVDRAKIERFLVED